MQPRIQYAKTEDGASIAFWTMGEGEPLVLMPLIPLSRIDAEWENPWYRQWFEKLASFRTVIRYDNRGSGLSERKVKDFSIDAMVRDLEAVIDNLGLTEFALHAHSNAGPSAITFAVRHPERLSHLILWESAANTASFKEMPALRTVHAMLDGDWDIFTETFANVALGWRQPVAHEMAQFFRASVSQETYRAFYDAEHDASTLLSDITTKTLISHERGAAHHVVEFAQELAANIPTAQLLLVDEGQDGFPSDQAIQAVREFLQGDETAAREEAGLPSGMTAIVFLDIADSTALTTELGDSAYREKERELDASLRNAITDAGGTPVEGKVLGDGVMAVFTSARQAIDGAVRCRDLGNEAGLALHLGIHAGDVVREGNNVHGGAVQVASRVQGVATPGEILVSATVRDLARTSAGVAFEDRGEHDLKGIPEPQRLFAVREQA